MPHHLQTVTEYMREARPTHLDALTELREICLQTLPGFKESMEYGVPTYSHNGKAEVSWNSQKDHISLFLMNPDIIKKYKPQLKNLDINKSCIRYKNPSQIDFDLIKKILTDIAQNI